MNRREFLTTTGVAVGAATLPLPSLADGNRYPYIGQRLVGYLFTHEDDYIRAISHLYRPITPSRIVKSHVLSGSNSYEFIISKLPPYFANQFAHSHAPASFMYQARTIIDLETYEVLKDRNGKSPKYLQIPEGADVELVMKNRSQIG